MPPFMWIAAISPPAGGDMAAINREVLFMSSVSSTAQDVPAFQMNDRIIELSMRIANLGGFYSGRLSGTGESIHGSGC